MRLYRGICCLSSEKCARNTLATGPESESPNVVRVPSYIVTNAVDSKMHDAQEVKYLQHHWTLYESSWLVQSFSMAKAKPSLTLVEMESRLGYKVDSLTYPDESSKRFYSDLRPVPNSIYEKTKVEFEEYEKEMYRKDEKSISEKALPELNVVKVSVGRP